MGHLSSGYYDENGNYIPSAKRETSRVENWWERTKRGVGEAIGVTKPKRNRPTGRPIKVEKVPPDGGRPKAVEVPTVRFNVENALTGKIIEVEVPEEFITEADSVQQDICCGTCECTVRRRDDGTFPVCSAGWPTLTDGLLRSLE